MVGLLLVGIVGAVLVLYAAERITKARTRGRRVRAMTERLDAATARTDQQQEQRQATEQAGAALTSFMPAIQRPPLSVPDAAPHGAARRDRAAQRDHGPARPRRRTGRTSEHPVRPADPTACPADHPVRPAEHSVRTGDVDGVDRP